MNIYQYSSGVYLYFCICEADSLLTLPIAIQRRAYIIKPISDSLTSIVYIVLAPNLRTGVV
jgi:hypothetical protein